MRTFFFSDRSRRPRGATLVEMAIVMAVVGLLSWASFMTMRALEERRQLEAEMGRLEVVRDAIVGYALRHRTRAREIRFMNANAPEVSRVFKLPGGRPYLPCPDWDGDGYEDRIPDGADGFVQGVEVKPDLTVTATIGFYALSRTLFWFSEGEDDNNEWRPYGDCRVARGTVPWRTLGVEPSDGWGNRHTYYADRVFSNAIFGFDRQTIADIYDPYLPDSPGIALSKRGIPGIIDLEIGRICPAVICDASRSRDCTTFGLSQNPVNCKSGVGNLILKAGARAKEEIDGRKNFLPGEVTDGLPFVLVSHGPNGRFAMNHWASLDKRKAVCNDVAWSTPTPFGPIIIRYVPMENPSLFNEAANGQHELPLDSECWPLFVRFPDDAYSSFPLIFIWEPPGIGDKSEFDDLLLWMTRGELSLSVPGEIPLLPRMVIAYFP